MMSLKTIPLLVLCILYSCAAFSQDLLDLLKSEEVPVINYTNATFKTTRIVIGQSIENTPKGNAQFLISHHFGKINSGYQNIFGLNQAFIRIGGEYGITDWLAAGVGLNTYKITWDGFVKAKILRQSTGARRMPLSLSGYASVAMNTVSWEDPERENHFSSRLSYAFELIMARKFSDWLSIQLMPALVHRNLVETSEDHNDVFSIGAGGRIKVSKRVAFNAEYHYVLPDQIDESVHVSRNSLSVGVDIETGGHVFQIFLTNSEGLIEQYFIPETKGKWSYGDIYLGFNISRILTVVKPKMN